MHFQIVFLVLIVIVSTIATLAVDIKKDQERDRFLLTPRNIFSFTTFTLIKQTTITTSTFTSTTTCTTSTTTLTTCTIGRRRRGLFYDEDEIEGRNRRGLFYNDEEIDNNESNPFLVSEKDVPSNSSSSDQTAFIEVVKTAADDVIPLEIESGFNLEYGGPNRFLLSFGTSTITSIFITTQTISLTAFCSSTTGFPLCSASGK